MTKYASVVLSMIIFILYRLRITVKIMAYGICKEYGACDPLKRTAAVGHDHKQLQTSKPVSEALAQRTSINTL